MRALRTVPVLLDVCADMEQLCGDATLLQYVNPMAINCTAINRASTIRTVGLCHSVQHTAAQLAGDLNQPRSDPIPPQLAALMHTNINVQSLTVEAILHGNRDHVYHAAMLDPHTAAELDPDQIRNLVDDLIDAHGDYIPDNLRSP